MDPQPHFTLVGFPRSRAMRVAWMLEELGLAYDWRPDMPHAPELAALNPEGKIPVLCMDDVVLRDSVAIVQFLADRAGRFTAPAGTLARAEQDAATQFCVDEIEGALWTAAKNSFIHPEGVRVEQIKDVCRLEFDRAMVALAGRLGDRPFVTGEEFTVPDLLLGHCAGWARMAKFDLPGGPVGAYFERLAARPAFERALARASAVDRA